MIGARVSTNSSGHADTSSTPSVAVFGTSSGKQRASHRSSGARILKGDFVLIICTSTVVGTSAGFLLSTKVPLQASASTSAASTSNMNTPGAYRTPPGASTNTRWIAYLNGTPDIRNDPVCGCCARFKKARKYCRGNGTMCYMCWWRGISCTWVSGLRSPGWLVWWLGWRTILPAQTQYTNYFGRIDYNMNLTFYAWGHGGSY